MPPPTAASRNPTYSSGLRRVLRRMHGHRDQHIDQRRAAENQRHHVIRQPARLERPDDAHRPQRTQRAADDRPDGAARIESAEPALRRKPRHRHQYADQKIGESHAQQRLQRIAELRLPLVQRRSVHAPRQHRANHKYDPHFGTLPPPFLVHNRALSPSMKSSAQLCHTT